MVRPVIALVAVLSGCTPAATGEGTPPPSAPPQGKVATVTRVLDGDSFEVTIDGSPDEVRLIGIDAPEPGECHADESRDLLAALVGDRVVLVGDDRDQFGRMLSYAYREVSPVNQDMVTAGGAVAQTPDHLLRADLLAAETEAERTGAGLWGVCRSPEAGSVTIFEIAGDAPGRDDENPNGEWVVLANEGGDRDLSGWSVRDESSTHRYRFPDGTRLAAGGFLLLRSGCGDDTGTEVHWCAAGPVWNNDGDSAFVLDAAGRIVAHRRWMGTR